MVDSTWDDEYAKEVYKHKQQRVNQLKERIRAKETLIKESQGYIKEYHTRVHILESEIADPLT